MDGQAQETMMGEPAAAVLAAVPLVRELELQEVVTSPTNYRRTFDEPALQELADDIREHGLLQPVLVRPVERDGEPLFELVFGERRYRASVLAGLATIPAMVRQLSDREALEIAIVENSKRSDVHPLEEAEGYHRLHQEHGMSVADLAAKLGKSPAHVYGRLALCKLVTEARTAYLQGKITHGAAVVLAKMPHQEHQRDATVQLLRERGLDEEPDEDGEIPPEGPVTAADAASLVRARFTLRMLDAPFDAGDGGLVPEAGACTTCPKRTGTQADLFADLAVREDRCTDQKCWGKKRDAAWHRKAEAATAEGRKVVDGEDAKKLFDTYGQVRADSALVDLDDVEIIGGERKTYRELLGDQVPPTTLARDDRGDHRELVPVAVAKKAADKAAKAAEVAREKVPAPAQKRPEEPPWQKHQREQEKKRAAALATVAPVVAAVVAAAEKQGPNDAAMRIVLARMFEDQYVCDQAILDRRGIKFPGHTPFVKLPAVSAMAGKKLFALVLEVALSDVYEPLTPDEEPEPLKAACKAYGLNYLALANSAKNAAEKARIEREAAAAAKKPKPKGKAPPAAKKAAPKKAAAKKKR